MGLTGFNLRRRRIAEAKKSEPVISKPVVEEKVEVETPKPETSTTKVVHKKTTKK